MTTQTGNLTKFDKLIGIPATLIGLCTLIYTFFGLTGFAVIGTVIAVVAIICLLAWVNEKTGGALGFWLIFSALSDN